MAQLIQAPGQEELGGNAWQELCAVRRLQWEKFLKAKLEDSVELFNDDYRKGFQMMQARPPSLLDSARVQRPTARVGLLLSAIAILILSARCWGFSVTFASCLCCFGCRPMFASIDSSAGTRQPSWDVKPGEVAPLSTMDATPHPTVDQRSNTHPLT